MGWTTKAVAAWTTFTILAMQPMGVANAQSIAAASGSYRDSNPGANVAQAVPQPPEAQPLERFPVASQAREFVDPLVRPTSAQQTQPTDTAELARRLEAAEVELAALKEQSAPESLGDRLQSLEDAFKTDKNKLPLIRLSGFFHFDTGFFSQTPNSIATLGDIQNGSGFRRARLQGLGNLTEFTRYSIEMDFGSAGAGRPSFQDVWGEQTNLPIFGAIRVGQYRQPITMDSWTNIRHLEFMERSAPFQAFDPFRRVGAMAYRVSEDEMSLLAYSVYGTGVTFWNGVSTTYNTTGVDNRFATQIGDTGGVSFATRATHLLYYDEPAEGRYLLHIGGGYNFSEVGGNGTTGTDARAYEARAIPEFFVGDSAAAGLTAGGTPPVVSTGRFLATSYNLYHLELAGNYGSAHFQAEYMISAVNQMAGPMVFYDGAYIQAGYFLTGESCGYNKQAGVLDYNVKPFSDFFGLKNGMCGWGAWEVAARWSWLDLSARNIDPTNQLVIPGVIPPSPNPGILNESTVALNWWWNQYTRVQFNWIHAMLDNNARGYSQFDLFAMRFQIEF